MILERLGIPGANVLGTNYTVTSLTVSDYNPNIDSTVTLTVTVKDVYNRPVVGEEVTVTASDGDFTQLDGSTITAASSVTGTTNNSGQFILTYTCSEWGLITFSAKNHKAQISVTGWKQVQTLASDKVRVFTDGKNAKIQIAGTFSTSTSSGQYNLATINSQYQPAEDYSTNYSASVITYYPVYILSNDTVVHIKKESTSSANMNVYCALFYPLKTPLY